MSPRAQRYNVFLTATAERFGQQQVTRHRVRNLSSDGACIDSAGVFCLGQTLIISVGSLAEVSAQVRWARNGLAGLQFMQPVEVGRALGKAAIPPKSQFG
jgi:hypothetical protein